MATKKCSKCGRELAENAKFCPECGAKAIVEKVKKGKNKEKKQKSVGKSIFLGLGIVYILIIAWWLFSPFLDKVIDAIPDGAMPYIVGAIIALFLLDFLVNMTKAVRDRKATFITYICLLAFIIDAVIAVQSGIRLYELSKDMEAKVEFGIVEIINDTLDSDFESDIHKEKNTLFGCVIVAVITMGIYESCKDTSEKIKSRREKKLAAETPALSESEKRDYIFCQECGMKISATAKFCGGCGAKINE